MQHEWHSLDVEEVISILHADHKGLNQSEAALRLKEYGFNKIQVQERNSLLRIFLHQFLNPLVFILIIAAIAKLFVSNALDSSVLGGTILLMVSIGFVQEAKAEHAMQALKKLAAHKSKIKREEEVQIIPSENIVPGDILVLESGDRIPADARLMETSNFKIDESSLSGESIPVEKHSEKLEGIHSLVDRKNMIFMGTTVACGKATAISVSTGMNTELGKIASTIEEIEPEKTSLEKSVNSIGIRMIPIILSAIIIFTILCLYRGMGWVDIFLLSVAAAVSAIPEGLGTAFIVALAAGMNTMAKRHAIIRKMVAVETLGSTTIICTDKTGTLTHNQMTVTTLYSPGKVIHITGEGYNTSGEFQIEGKTLDPKEDPSLRQLLEIGVLCNDALISTNKDTYSVIGDPTEGAMIVAALKGGYKDEILRETFPRINEIPFQSENFYMATLHSVSDSRKIYVKGAPEKILSFSNSVLKEGQVIPLTDPLRDELNKAMHDLSAQGLRLIAAGYCEPEKNLETLIEDSFRGRLIFTGIFGMIDPPRQETIESIKTCKEAGIKVVMITGDNKITAEAIGKQVGIASEGALTGNEIEEVNGDDLKEKIKNVGIFARVGPLHKLKIVQAYKSLHEIVAMTGDGVNDAPALETANIGVAMGISGTDVAKESADIILSDDNFASIVAAVEEGRVIFNRLRNVCAFLLTTCFGELLGLILCVLFIGKAPLLSLQILWINLVTGVVISVPLGLEPKIGDELKHPPRDPEVKLVYLGMIYRIAYLSLMLGISLLFIFDIMINETDLITARTMVLTTVVIFEWLVALNMRSVEIPFYRQGVFKNRSLVFAIVSALVLHLAILYIPILQTPFHTVALSLNQWGVCLLPGLIIFIIEILRKEIAPNLFSQGKWKKNLNL